MDAEDRTVGDDHQNMDDDWRTLFGHAAPYENQVDGIETAIGTAEQGGFTVIEGACGTGKTMLALAAGLSLVRDPDSAFERVFVLTSVKQQLRQFETDVRTINESLPEDWRPISALTLVGKADVCPYRREGAAGIDRSNVYDRCESLRDRTRTLADHDGPTTASALTLDARSQQTGLAASGEQSAARYLETAGEPTPYPPWIPDHQETEYCPFYAQYLDELPEDGDPVEAVPFDFADSGVLTPEDLVARSASHGTCPHSMMGALLSHVEVVIGNYYHAFDPTTTATFTGALCDESTFVVCDEAHMLEPRVRSLVSDSVADATLRDADTELTRVIQPVRFEDRGQGTETDAALVRRELEDGGVTLAELETTRRFVRELREELDRRITAHLDRTVPTWRANPRQCEDDELPLRDPEVPEPDAITTWAADAGFDDGTWVRAETVGAVVERILNEVDEDDRSRATPAVGRLLGTWYRADHVRYFREIELARTWNEVEPPDSWRRAYNARLAVHNCVPSDAIAERLASFGGGILMSATLEPMDVFATVTGLDSLKSAGRPVVSRRYGMPFPDANRASFAVAAPAFTYANRGSPGEENTVRRLYLDLLQTIASYPGNVLVGMPNYAEAEWAAASLEERISKPVLLDGRSDDGTTEALKRDFFDGESKVLVTSLRGTLTEGVDYRGDRLAAAVVCGVPIVNTKSPRTRAVRTAYDREFGNGFRYALSVPAVRKARQAVGRVIRGADEVGVRILLDERYARASWDSVRELLPEDERDEFQPVSPDMVSVGLERFTASTDD